MIGLFFTGMVVFLIYLFCEYYILNTRLKKIPVRILVNGTRGKSTTVRILYHILYQQKRRVYAKTTGNVPEILEPDQNVRLVKRNAPVNIGENIRLLRQWAADKTDAVILEDMALHPEMQRTLSRFIFKPTHTIITNILPDHQEVMGEDLEQNAKVILASINQSTIVFVTESSDEMLEKSGMQVRSKIICKNTQFSEKFVNVPAEIINQNWSLICKVSEIIGLRQEQTMECFSNIWKSVDQSLRLDLSAKHTEFWNLFSVNDIHTAAQFMNFRLLKTAQPLKHILLLNCRDDRPLRTKSFLGLVDEKYPDAEVWLTGNGRHLASRYLENRQPQKAVYCGRSEQVLNKIRNGFTEQTILFGLGNYKGIETLLSEIESLADSKRD